MNRHKNWVVLLGVVPLCVAGGVANLLVVVLLHPANPLLSVGAAAFCFLCAGANALMGWNWP